MTPIPALGQMNSYWPALSFFYQWIHETQLGFLKEDSWQMSFAINDLLLSNVVFSLLWTQFNFAKSCHHLLCLSTLIEDLELVTGHLQAPAERDQLKRTTISRCCLTAAKRFCLICEFLFYSCGIFYGHQKSFELLFLFTNSFCSLLLANNMVFKI